MGQLVTNHGLLGNSACVDRHATATVNTLFIFCFSYTVNVPNFVTWAHLIFHYGPVNSPSPVHSGVICGGPMQLTVGADKSLGRPGRKANVSVRMAWISFGALPCRKRNLIAARVSILLKSHRSLTYFRACFIPGRAKNLSVPGIYNFAWNLAVLSYMTMNKACIYLWNEPVKYSLVQLVFFWWRKVMLVLFHASRKVTGGLPCHIKYVTIFVPRTAFFIT